MTHRGTMETFFETHAVTMTATRVERNPNMADMPEGSRHWRCVLRYAGRRLTVPFSQGPAHTAVPSPADVLDCLASDAAGLDNTRGFEDWCSDYGYDTDSRRAERTYRAVKRSAAGLLRLLGPGAYGTLLWNTDRL